MKHCLFYPRNVSIHALELAYYGVSRTAFITVGMLELLNTPRPLYTVQSQVIMRVFTKAASLVSRGFTSANL